MPNCHVKLSQEPVRRATEETQYPINVQPLIDGQNGITNLLKNSAENAPLNGKNETKDELRKYVKMVSPIEIETVVSVESSSMGMLELVNFLADCGNAAGKRGRKNQKQHFQPAIGL